MPTPNGADDRPCCKLVDGYNVIRRLPHLRAAEQRSLADGRAALLDWLVPHFRGTRHRLVVVFDGDGPAETTQPLRCGAGSQQIFTRRGENADMVIVRRAVAERAAGNQVEVYTDDVAVLMTSAGYGALGAGTHALAGRHADAPSHLRKRALHHEHVRNDLDKDREDAAGDRRPRKGNPRKAPRRRDRQR
jgi:predicted RNA-binding protein with PIN domain